jgi:hypothetical protein
MVMHQDIGNEVIYRAQITRVGNARFDVPRRWRKLEKAEVQEKERGGNLRTG